jgi:hypothetical protein
VDVTTKRCSRCSKEKSIEEFAKNSARKDGRTTYCRSCMKDYNATYYIRTKERHNPARAVRRQEVKAETRTKLVEYLLEHPCVDCGETDIVVLQFDHQANKLFSISDAITNMVPWELILTEIEKCEVVCANDHQRRTAATFGWHKLKHPCAGSSVVRAADS